MAANLLFIIKKGAVPWGKRMPEYVRYTKFVLKRSLLQLLSRKPVNKITVKEVCEIADVGLPDTNRALTARVTPALILCGRGRYISPENAVIDITNCIPAKPSWIKTINSGINRQQKTA